MKKFIFAGLLALFVMSCNGNGISGAAGAAVSDSVAVDSVAVDSTAVDSVAGPVGDSTSVVLK